MLAQLRLIDLQVAVLILAIADLVGPGIDDGVGVVAVCGVGGVAIHQLTRRDQTAEAASKSVDVFVDVELGVRALNPAIELREAIGGVDVAVAVGVDLLTNLTDLGLTGVDARIGVIAVDGAVVAVSVVVGGKGYLGQAQQ